ncbi:MAG TPA: hypothetical protein VK092_05860, partial [Deinococcales bacterium]|nr:hypothetical protein [Deinococcales bacterium]
DAIEAGSEATEPAGGQGSGDAAERRSTQEALAELAELRAGSLDEQATAHDLLAEATQHSGEHARAELRARAQAAEQRARGYTERARAAEADDESAGERYRLAAAAADERAREREQWALAERARATAATAESDDDAAVERARATMHESWAARHEAAAQEYDAQAAGDEPTAERARERATRQEGAALAAEHRVTGAEHNANAAVVRGELEATDQSGQREAERERAAEQRAERIRERVQRREHAQRSGLRRFAPGPGTITAGRRAGLDAQQEAEVEQVLDHEIEVVSRALREHGPVDRAELAQLVGARYWGPGRFGQALRAAVNEGRARRLSRRTYGPPDG